MEWIDGWIGGWMDDRWMDNGYGCVGDGLMSGWNGWKGRTEWKDGWSTLKGLLG